MTNTPHPTTYDALVIGGGAAGLSGALTLARSRRSVAVIDAGTPRNAPAQGVHALLGHDGIPPAELLSRGRDEVRRHGGRVITGHVRTATRHEDHFTLTLADTTTLRARRLLVATGLSDILPDIPGLARRWGRDVVHCPYCHGWEVRDQPIGVLATGPLSVHQTLLFRQLSADTTLFTHTHGPLTDEQAEQLAARGVDVVHGTVTALETDQDRITGLRMDDGRLIPRRVIAVATRMRANTDPLTPLGLRPVPHPSGMGEHLPADPTGRTDVPGVWVAGNATDLSAQVGSAAAAGALAGAHINADLVQEDTRRALAAHRAPLSPAAEAGLHERTADPGRRHGL
ncbi:MULTISPECIES: NAD(P)/FAD-dependent oxidoreductase [unclassified Nocardiopsis]|uniref:NAD(P)/FAD-dependent oxidoreductase n=1 Tax=unclassified Nocardiopsis TaxID=2649073 RepID=UPI00135AD1D0|nr:MULTISPECIES: NAD(P)/FAD-dependent oxidoreductase [unclassified Nocardiopsis]